ncbi:DNA repair protein RadA [Helicobacter enhydrae]|uniref:DNA repair protein RadA n=1 Tax=Helicobacter enhydrae TaxID=222136 RepID=A0A1B1U656_9HELI|nr:DNA repair protein RadA [Helicobacter enhydrae]ANV98239.1 DNA repair protein RadA [Helicobacter enhydrae]
MSKKKHLFECQHCGFQSPKWLGKCPNCNTWESFIELNPAQIQALKDNTTTSVAIPITQVEVEHFEKFSSFEKEFDIVLGGGIVPGGLYLIGGNPGVGKSTLLLKIASNLASQDKKVLYVSGEESLGQIKLRSMRLNCLNPNLFLLSEINLESILAHLLQYHICVIDSIQTLFSPNISSAPGSVSQVRESTFALMRIAKENNLAIFIIGHITKEGSIAGPRVLEHMVDCVLYFEGDPSKELRILRSFKNRFGTTSDVGIFQMKEDGLASAKEFAHLFFEQKKPMAGSAITVVLEGSRAIILEIQALVSESSFGAPKRLATGFDNNRLNMLLALLEKKLEIPLNRYDVFINVSGGIKITETSADLAVVASIISSFKNRPLNQGTAFLGEVSLTGDIRQASNIDIRLKELENQNFTKAIVAKKPTMQTPIKCFAVEEVTKLLDWM